MQNNAQQIEIDIFIFTKIQSFNNLSSVFSSKVNLPLHRFTVKQLKNKIKNIAKITQFSRKFDPLFQSRPIYEGLDGE